MKRAQSHTGWPVGPATSVLHLRFRSDSHSVRRALGRLMDGLQDVPGGDALPGVVEIVLAEVLNNVVEHAYGAAGRGVVQLDVARTQSALCFRVMDEGVPMAGQALPTGRAHDIEVPTDDLPEGGFGWFLIRALTEKIRYTRNDGANELTFRIPFDSEAPGT